MTFRYRQRRKLLHGSLTSVATDTNSSTTGYMCICGKMSGITDFTILRMRRKTTTVNVDRLSADIRTKTLRTEMTEMREEP